MKKDVTKDYFEIAHSNTTVEEKRYLEYRRKWDYYTEIKEVGPAPLHVDIEVTSVCNLECFMCERHKMTRKNGFMEYTSFCRIVDECANSGVYSVKLEGWGESLLHKDIFRMIGYAKQRGLFTSFNSNATLATEDKIRGLIDAGLDRITLSVESLNKDIYESIRRGAKLEETLENIESFIRLKPIGAKPLLTLQIMKMKKNQDYIADFVKRYKDRVDFISMTNVTSVTGDSDILKESLVDYKSLPKIPCPQLWQRLSIYWNGDVTACCGDNDGHLKLGNIKKASLSELWNGERLNELRKRHKRRDFKGLICETCTANHRL